ncbi:MAG: stage III sporulation protein AF [Lachnospiraceae bacterium]|nr:stage III sporulation protein AF [Lachnospiraceae bacterium]
MVGVIKEICIFIIIAQAILFFVPGQSYVKYVRILVGIIMILRMTEPIFALVLSDDRQQEIRERIQMMEDKMDMESEKTGLGGSEMGIYESLEKELKNRLDHCESDYEILRVNFSEDIYSGTEYSGDEEIIITVSEKCVSSEDLIRIDPITLDEREESDFEKEEELKSMYGNCIGVDTDRIRIILEQ